MTLERIITAATITSGEKHDGKQLQELVRKFQKKELKLKLLLVKLHTQKRKI